MAANKQYVISLNRLIVPPEKNNYKMTLSVVTPPDQYFIQNEKFVKGNKINFYRQNLFIHEYSADLYFNLYEIDANNKKKLIKTFTTSRLELDSIHRRPTMFHIKLDNYELVWDSWIFSEDSSYLNQQSEKDYTELDLPFENKDGENISLILANSHSQNSRFSKMIRATESYKKRSSSTEEASSLPEKDFQFSDGSENKSIQANQAQQKPKTGLFSRNAISFVASIEKRKKTHIKSNLYSYLVTGITELLSPTKG